MKYEIVNLEEKIVVGKSIITSNNDPKMGEQIGALWQKFYDSTNGFYCEIKNKANENGIGLYSDYVEDKYTLTVGTEVKKVGNKDFSKKIILKGKYAKFSIQGNMIKSVADAWEKIWKLDLNRTFTGDFEEYLPCTHCEIQNQCDINKCNSCKINIYIAIK